MSFDTVEIDLRDGRSSASRVDAAPEVVMSIVVNGRGYKTVLCSPGMEKEFVIGQFFAEGIIDSPNDIRIESVEKSRIVASLRSGLELRLKLASEKRVVAADCAPTESSFLTLLDRAKRPAILGSTKVSVSSLAQMMRLMNQNAVIYKSCRGIHSAGLFVANGEPISFSEDISRHNAVDKVLGAGLLREIDFSHAIVTCTGRPTVTMVSKLVRAGVPIAASLSTPSKWGVKLARETGVTLVLFKGKAIVYSHPSRIAEASQVEEATASQGSMRQRLYEP